MKNYLLLLILLTVAIPFELLKAEKQINPADTYPDSLLSIAHIRQKALDDPDEALLMLDESERRDLLPTFQINWTRAQIYGGHKKMERMAVEWGKLVLEDDSVRNNPQYYFNMCKNLLESMIYTQAYEEAVQYARSMIHVIERSGKPTDNNHTAYWVLARVYRAMGDSDEAYKALDKAIEMCENLLERKIKDQAPSVSDALLLFRYLECLCNWKEDDGKPELSLQSAQAMQKVVEQLRPLRGGTYPRQIPDAVFMQKEGIATGMTASLLQQLGKKSEAEKWFARLLNNPLVDKEPELIRQVISYYLISGNYKEVIERAQPLASSSAYTDTIHIQRKRACLILADAYEKLGKTDEAVAAYQMAVTLTDSLQQRNQKSNALELATLMDTQEKEKQIEKQAATIRLHKTILYSACGLAVMLFAILGLIVRHSRVVIRKNRVMAKQINDRLFYHDELQKAHQRIQELEEKMRQQLPMKQELPAHYMGKETEETSKTSVKSDKPEAINVNDKKSFEKLDAQIRNQKLFLDPNLSRDQILQLTSIGKNRLSPLIQISTGENLNGYINGLRLDYSLSLLNSRNNYTIEAIAIDSGFNNVRTYQRLFRLKYGMTPMEYRNSH